MQLQADRTPDGLFLSTQVRLDVPATVEEALNKGIALFFVAEAELLRDRWYWYDQKVASAAKHMRLAYQPLTRRWRLNISPEPIGTMGLGVSFSQNYESLADALRAVERISRWKIAEADALDTSARHTVVFRFRLDVTQLPRPFQIGAAGHAEWDMSASRSLRLAPEEPR